MTAPLRLGVLASGRGSNLPSLREAATRGDLPAEIAVVISNNAGAGALAGAHAAGLPTAHISGKTHTEPDRAIVECLRAHGVDVVVLAGYLKLVGPAVLAAFPGRIVNIHPAPLPEFGGRGMYGRGVHEAVLAAGVSTSGPTVHLVTENYDEGPILAHEPVPVRPDDDPDTLAQRVFEAETRVYWRAIRDQFCRTMADSGGSNRRS